MSQLTAFGFIQERSEGTPGLWNRIFSQLSDNMRSVAEGPFSGSTDTLSFSTNLEVTGGAHFQFLSVGSTPPSYVTTALITMAARSDQSDYLYFTDSSGLRSNYVIGSRAGGTADGLNIWDASGATMIASFSKQSIRFYQNVVGPVFDVGGALANTINAATFGTGADSKESRIQAAMDQASISGISRVYVPANMYPYSASSMSFYNQVQMVREGGDWSVYDVLAYGADPTTARSSTSAIQAAINATGNRGLATFVPPGTYLVEGLSFYSKSVIRGVVNAGGNGGSVFYMPSAATTILHPKDPTISTNYFTLEDIGLSAFGNTNCLGGVDLVNCAVFTVRNVGITGTKGFNIRVVGGPVAGDAGFGIVADCVLINTVAGATLVQLQSATNDQPDGCKFTNNHFNTGSDLTWIASIATVGTGCATAAWVGNTFEASGTPTSAITGTMASWMFVGNRFETTAGGGVMTVDLHPAQTNPPAVFVGNSWSGAVTWRDAATWPAQLYGETRDLNIARTEVAAGSVLQPGLSFSSENSLGLYRSAASTIAQSYGTFSVSGLSTNGITASSRTLVISGTTVQLPLLTGDLQWGVDNNFQLGNNSKRPYSVFAGTLMQTGNGTAAAPGYQFSGEAALGWYRSAASTMALSYGTLRVGELYVTGSGISIGNATAGGSLIPAISSTSSRVAAFVVQPSASSFTVITWAAVQPGDQILTTVQPDAAVSSLSSGLVAHSHATKAGQFEFRLSNVSTLAQNQSQKTWYFTRISPF